MQNPGYDFLSAPLWLITSLHLLTLTLHLVAMNFVVGGLVAILWGKFTNRWADQTVQTFLKLFPSGLAATVTLGVAPLLFLQLVYHRQVYSAAIVSGWFWLMITVAVIITYYLLYAAAFKAEQTSSKSILLTIALAGLAYVSLVYSSVFSMAERPDLIAHLYAQNQSGVIWNPELGDWVLRWLHMIFGAITVGGFFVGLIGRKSDEAFKVGKTFFLLGLVVASLAGIGYLLSLADYLKQFMHSAGIWSLTFGVILSLGSMHFFFTKKFLPSGLMLFVSVFLMVLTRHEVRLLKLQSAFEPTTIPVKTQWGPFLLFLVCFVIAIGIMVYMFRLFLKNHKTA